MFSGDAQRSAFLVVRQTTFCASRQKVFLRILATFSLASPRPLCYTRAPF